MEKRVNEWIFANRYDIDIVDIRMSSYSAPNEDDPAEPHRLCDVMILYNHVVVPGS